MAKLTIPVPSEPISKTLYNIAGDQQLMSDNWYRQIKKLFNAWNRIADFSQTQQRGTVTVTGTATTQVKTLSPALDAATYTVVLTPSAITGTPLATAYTITQIAKTTSQFTITVMAAPGVGNSVTFDYAVFF